MIGKICGVIERVENARVLIMNAGVGYIVYTNTGTLADALMNIGSPFCFETYLVVRENALDLYGFLTLKELNTFTLLLTVSGIGPKSALSILSLVDVTTLEKAVTASDANYLTKVSGIGKKNAEKIVLELKGKLVFEHEEGSTPHTSVDTDALEALLTLGYSQREARDALTSIPKDLEGVDMRIKAALRALSSKT